MKTILTIFSILLFILLILALLLFSSCVFKAETYEHKPTIGIRHNACKESFEDTTEFQAGGVLFVPDFSTFTKSFSSHSTQNSFLLLYSKERTQLYLEKAILFSGNRSHEAELIIDKTIQINQLSVQSSVYGEVISLFTNKNMVPKPFWDEGDLFLQLFFINPRNGESENVIFELSHRSYLDIAMP